MGAKRRARRRVNTAPETRPLLAKLRGVAPETIVGPTKANTDELDAFMLSLAAFFNDFRDYLVWHSDLEKRRPGPGRPSARRGEWTGTQAHLWRLICSALHELIVLIQKNKDQVRDARFVALVQKQHAVIQDYWAAVESVALETRNSRSDGLTKFLRAVRNDIGFHYYVPSNVVTGYRRFFFDRQGPEGPVGAEGEQAYLSPGVRIADTRFYFADAALQGALTHRYEVHGVPERDQLVIDFAECVGKAVGRLLISHYCA